MADLINLNDFTRNTLYIDIVQMVHVIHMRYVNDCVKSKTDAFNEEHRSKNLVEPIFSKLNSLNLVELQVVCDTRNSPPAVVKTGLPVINLCWKWDATDDVWQTLQSPPL